MFCNAVIGTFAQEVQGASCPGLGSCKTVNSSDSSTCRIILHDIICSLCTLQMGFLREAIKQATPLQY